MNVKPLGTGPEAFRPRPVLAEALPRDRFETCPLAGGAPPSAAAMRAACAERALPGRARPSGACEARPAGGARGPADPLPLPHDLTGSTSYNRVNLPWFRFGVDFGVTAWGDLGIRNNPEVAPTLDELRRRGVEDVVTWTIPDGRTIQFAADGTPTGLAPGFREDLTALLDLLSERGMSAELVLIDGNTWFLPGEVSAGVPMRGHGDVIADRSGRKQAAFDANVLGPMLDTIKAWQRAHPDAPLPVSGINLGNELEYGVNRDPRHPGKNVPSMEPMKAFTRGRAALVHRELPGVPVTVGAARPGDMFDNWLFSGLDYYTFHHYGPESMIELADTYPWPGPDKPVHMGEYPGRQRSGATTDVRDYLDGVAGTRGAYQRRETPDRFLTTAAMWASRSVDRACPTDPSQSMADVQDWIAESFRD